MTNSPVLVGTSNFCHDHYPASALVTLVGALIGVLVMLLAVMSHSHGWYDCRPGE